MLKKIKNKKKAVSLMISYVLLISIAIILAVGVFVWLKYLTDVSPPVDCEPGTSVILNGVSCSLLGIELNLKNNGRFNIDGIILTVGNESEQPPINSLIPRSLVNEGLLAGHYFLNSPLKPGQNNTVYFSNQEYEFGTNNKKIVDFEDIRVIQIQPFIEHKTGVIICSNAVIKEKITDCKIK